MLIETAPTTKAGARAAIEWLLEYNRGCEPREVGRFAITLLRSPVLADREAPVMTDAASLFIEIRPGMRKALADAVEAFLNLLDQIDADAEDNPPECAMRGRG